MKDWSSDESQSTSVEVGHGNELEDHDDVGAVQRNGDDRNASTASTEGLGGRSTCSVSTTCGLQEARTSGIPSPVQTIIYPCSLRSQDLQSRQNSQRRFPESSQFVEDITATSPLPDPICIENREQDINNSKLRGREQRGTKRKQSTQRQRGAWTDEEMQMAIAEVDDGSSMRKASQKFHIPYASLREWCYGVRTSPKHGPPAILKPHEEQQLVDYVVTMCDLGYGLTPTALKLKVSEITSGRPTPFTNGIPRKGWMKWWKKRHPELSLRVAQSLNQARAQGLNADNSKSFYDNLDILYKAHSYSPDRIWNCDESGVQAGRDGGALILARRGTRTVQSVVPDNREWVSVLVCMNAAGVAIPSFYIFRGKRCRKNYIERCEHGASMAMQEKAWITSDLFLEWISHFKKNVEALGGISPEQRHLLILDGHNSHVTLEVAAQAKSIGLDLLTLPSHTSHALQPLDCSIFKPFKQYFRVYRDYWSSRHMTETASKETLAHWISLALRKALSPKNIRSGFKATGIYPFNPQAVQRHLKPSEVYGHTTEDDGEAQSLEAAIPQVPANDRVLDEDEEGEHQYSLASEDIAADFVEEQRPGVQHFLVGVHATDPEQPQEMQDLEADVEGIDSLTRFLTLPSIAPPVSKKHRDPVMDFTKSVILTSDDFMNAAAARRQDKIDAAHEKERLRLEKEEQKRKKAAKKAEEKQQRAEARALKALEREEARVQRDAQKLQKKCRRLDIQRQKVLQAAERGGGLEAFTQPSEGDANHVHCLQGFSFPTTTPVAAISSSSHDTQPYHQLITPLQCTLPSTPQPMFPYLVPTTYFSPHLYPQPLWPLAPPVYPGPVQSSACTSQVTTSMPTPSHLLEGVVVLSQEHGCVGDGREA